MNQIEIIFVLTIVSILVGIYGMATAKNNP